MSWNFWINDIGENQLKGVPCDMDNPCRLPDWMIQDILTCIPASRDNFNYWFPFMLPAEQARLICIIQGIPQHVALDPLDVSDLLQKFINTEGVHTTGPHGGGN